MILLDSCSGVACTKGLVDSPPPEGGAGRRDRNKSNMACCSLRFRPWRENKTAPSHLLYVTVSSILFVSLLGNSVLFCTVPLSFLFVFFSLLLNTLLSSLPSLLFYSQLPSFRFFFSEVYMIGIIWGSNPVGASEFFLGFICDFIWSLSLLQINLLSFLVLFLLASFHLLSLLSPPFTFRLSFHLTISHLVFYQPKLWHVLACHIITCHAYLCQSGGHTATCQAQIHVTQPLLPHRMSHHHLSRIPSYPRVSGNLRCPYLPEVWCNCRQNLRQDRVETWQPETRERIIFCVLVQVLCSTWNISVMSMSTTWNKGLFTKKKKHTNRTHRRWR